MSRDRFVKRRVTRVDQPVEVSALPAQDEIKPRAQGLGDPHYRVDAELSQPAALEFRHGRAWNRGADRQIELPPAPADPQCAHNRPQTMRVHTAHDRAVGLSPDYQPIHRSGKRTDFVVRPAGSVGW